MCTVRLVLIHQQSLQNHSSAMRCHHSSARWCHHSDGTASSSWVHVDLLLGNFVVVFGKTAQDTGPSAAEMLYWWQRRAIVIINVSFSLLLINLKKWILVEFCGNQRLHSRNKIRLCPDSPWTSTLTYIVT